MSKDRLLIALRLGDVAEIMRVREGVELDTLVRAAGAEDQIWPSPLVDGEVTMITLEGVRALTKSCGTTSASEFSSWLDTLFPESRAFASMTVDDMTSEHLHAVAEMLKKYPDIQPAEVAARLSISNDDALRHLTYLRLMRQLEP